MDDCLGEPCKRRLLYSFISYPGCPTQRVVHSPDRLNSTLFSLLVKAVCLIGCLIPAADYDGRMMMIGEDTTQDAILLLAADSLIRLELHGLHVCLEMWCFVLCHPHCGSRSSPVEPTYHSTPSPSHSFPRSIYSSCVERVLGNLALYPPMLPTTLSSALLSSPDLPLSLEQ
jgi:hypothetical protein